jgi:hypothetical protein
MVSDIHRNIVQDQEGSGGKHLSASDGRTLAATDCPPTVTDSDQVGNLSYRRTHRLTPESSILGESSPVPSRTFFGCDKLIDKIVDLVEDLIQIALIAASGICKTSIALAVLHHDRIKQRFGHYHRFIRCDQFPASSAHLLRRLSNATSAGVENPEDLTPLRTFLSSKEMVIALDNAESILDPQGTDAQEIYAVVEELSRFKICICITSRISTTPPDCQYPNVPMLLLDVARNTFYRLYDSHDDRSNPIDRIPEQLDLHPLSAAMLATVAHKNKWDTSRLVREWEQRRTGALQTHRILTRLSPAPRTWPRCPRASWVVAFFPQGVDENLKWLFPTISNRTDVFDKFCILSLTYRSNGFITMLAPLRDYLSPRDPKSSPLLCTTKERYFTRISVEINPNEPNFTDTMDHVRGREF